jgi:hypothetical protein
MSLPSMAVFWAIGHSIAFIVSYFVYKITIPRDVSELYLGVKNFPILQADFYQETS